MKTKKVFLAVFAAVLCAFVFGIATQMHWLKPPSKGIFYRIDGGKNELYVLGSIHVGGKEMYPLSDKVKKAIENADALIFECDTESETAIQNTQNLMFYQEDDCLSANVSLECFDLLTNVAQKLGYDMAALDKMKPWAVVSMLSMETLAAEMGGRDLSEVMEFGVENVVRKIGSGKHRTFLETAEAQLKTMDLFSPELQEYLLESACEVIHKQQVDDDLKHWAKWWAEGNAEAFAQSYQKGLEEEKKPDLAKEYHDALVTRRNKSMAETLRQLLETGENQVYFATIGLMHLVLPEDSVLAHLHEMGYTVERIQQ